MANRDDMPRQGDPFEPVIDDNPEDNPAQRNSDAPPDAVAEGMVGREPGSTGSGASPEDEAAAEERRRLYKEKGAKLVSRID